MNAKKLTSVITVCSLLSVLGVLPAKATDSHQNQRDEVVMLVNEQRKANGLNPLFESEFLNQVAQVRAEETIQKFSHERPDGRLCFTALTDMGGSYWSIGENIAYGLSTEKAVVNGWMNSQMHRENILSKDFGAIGIGVAESANGTLYWVQVFTDGEDLTPLYSTGDINSDEKINAQDASLILINSANAGAGNQEILSRMQKSYADVNHDGIVNALDATGVLRYSAYFGSGGTDNIETYLK